MFTKKNAEVEEQIMQDITDEQLSQVTGGGHRHHQVTGGGLNGYTAGVLRTTTTNRTGRANSDRRRRDHAKAPGGRVSSPSLSTQSTLVPPLPNPRTSHP